MVGGRPGLTQISLLSRILNVCLLPLYLNQRICCGCSKEPSQFERDREREREREREFLRSKTKIGISVLPSMEITESLTHCTLSNSIFYVFHIDFRR